MLGADIEIPPGGNVRTGDVIRWFLKATPEDAVIVMSYHSPASPRSQIQIKSHDPHPIDS